VRDGAAAHAATSGYGHPQRRIEPIGDRSAARVRHLGGESLQLIDENLTPLSDLVFRRSVPAKCRYYSSTALLSPSGDNATGRVCRSNGDIYAARMRATRYQSKATVGYQSGPREATSSING
jgi:hypothetical protein